MARQVLSFGATPPEPGRFAPPIGCPPTSSTRGSPHLRRLRRSVRSGYRTHRAGHRSPLRNRSRHPPARTPPHRVVQALYGVSIGGECGQRISGSLGRDVVIEPTIVRPRFHYDRGLRFADHHRDARETAEVFEPERRTPRARRQLGISLGRDRASPPLEGHRILDGRHHGVRVHVRFEDRKPQSRRAIVARCTIPCSGVIVPPRSCHQARCSWTQMSNRRWVVNAGPHHGPSFSGCGRSSSRTPPAEPSAPRSSFSGAPWRRRRCSDLPSPLQHTPLQPGLASSRTIEA